MIARLLAVLAAILLVSAVALAVMLPLDTSLGQALLDYGKIGMGAAQSKLQNYLPSWIWYDVAAPLLRRPVWLIPASVGIICFGVAVTLGSRSTHRSRRRS